VKRRVVILTEIIAPYRIPVFNALAAHPDLDLRVIFLSETDPGLRQWQVYRDEIRYSYEVLRSYRRRVGRFNILLTRGMRAALDQSNPQVVVAGGYNYLAMWQAQRWARVRRVPFLLWSESNITDTRRNFWWVEAAKRNFIRSCQGYIVPGSSAAAYLKTFKVPEDKIFVAPNAVDTERFARAAETAGQDPGLRRRLGLPPRYVLFVGRLVRAKGVFDLLAAYATLPEEIREAVSLVFAGDGPERQELARRSREIEPGRVVFTGFLQRDDLPAVYALGEAFVLPTHSDPWGLVVNEAMACGLPVVATRAAGCAADLVRDGENGYVVGEANGEELAQAMIRILTAAELRDRMGQRSRALSKSFTPEAWVQGAVRAVAGCDGESRG
jgi:glycosyltransferase involved in cell wall biosynthesis